MARRLTTALVSLLSLRCTALVPSSVKGVLMQSKIGELRFEQATTTAPSIESLVRGQPAVRLGGAAVSVALHYGQLTRGAGAGTRVLVKEYSAAPRSDPEPAEPARHFRHLVCIAAENKPHDLAHELRHGGERHTEL